MTAANIGFVTTCFVLLCAHGRQKQCTPIRTALGIEYISASGKCHIPQDPLPSWPKCNSGDCFSYLLHAVNIESYVARSLNTKPLNVRYIMHNLTAHFYSDGLMTLST